MKRKAKPRRRRSAAHIARYHRGIVQTPLRMAVEALLEPKRMANRQWRVTIADTAIRLANGRAGQFAFRHWLNGTRRAPAWFVAVLDGELARRIDRAQSIRALIAAEYTPQDRERAKANRAARARAQIMAGVGAIGARKRTHDAANAIEPPKNDPHN